MRRPPARAVCAVVVVVAALTAGVAPHPSSARPSQLDVDIELAVDTTGSMTYTLKSARQEAERIVAAVRNVVPAARFAVVTFRDPGNPGGEYDTLQNFTSDLGAVESAIGRLKAVRNPSPANLAVESYNLVFHRSYSDRELTWRPSSRKIVLVVGDAEPYGAGAAGVRGCQDDHPDPHGMQTASELARMRAAKRTLIMVRVVGSASTSLECYESLAALAYDGGAARDTRATDLVAAVVAVVGAAVAPVSIASRYPTIVPGTTTSLVMTIANLNNRPLHIADLKLLLPTDFAPVRVSARGSVAGSTVTWQVERTLPPRQRIAFRVETRASRRAQRATVFAIGHFDVDGSPSFASSTRTRISVTRKIVVRAGATGEERSISGRALFEISRDARLPAAAVAPRGRGTFTVHLLKHGWLRMRPLRARVSLLRGNARAVIATRVTATEGIAGCAPGAEGSVVVVDRAFGAEAGNTSIHLELARGCQLRATWLRGDAGGISPAL